MGEVGGLPTSPACSGWALPLLGRWGAVPTLSSAALTLVTVPTSGNGTAAVTGWLSWHFVVVGAFGDNHICRDVLRSVVGVIMFFYMEEAPQLLNLFFRGPCFLLLSVFSVFGQVTNHFCP